MLFVGHIAIAFIMCYVLSKILSIKRISFPLIMLLSVLPDIDIGFKLLGIDPGHRTFTHSAILALIVSVAAAFMAKLQRSAILVYSIAYFTHILIGDILINSVNILYPFGVFQLGVGIKLNSLTDIVIEFVPLLGMTAIVIREYFLYKKGAGDSILFHHSSLDQILYIFVILAVITSVVYLMVNEIKYNALSLNGIKLLENRLILMIMLHIFAIAIITFIWAISRIDNNNKAKLFNNID
ncbi:MAG: metal-dependent hydrolase [Nitrososphaeraceae archaeon]